MTSLKTEKNCFLLKNVNNEQTNIKSAFKKPTYSSIVSKGHQLSDVVSKKMEVRINREGQTNGKYVFNGNNNRNDRKIGVSNENSNKNQQVKNKWFNLSSDKNGAKQNVEKFSNDFAIKSTVMNNDKEIFRQKKFSEDWPELASECNEISSQSILHAYRDSLMKNKILVVEEKEVKDATKASKYLLDHNKNHPNRSSDNHKFQLNEVSNKQVCGSEKKYRHLQNEKDSSWSVQNGTKTSQKISCNQKFDNTQKTFDKQPCTSHKNKQTEAPIDTFLNVSRDFSSFMPAGLINLGKTCYFNSVFQLLYNNTDLVNEIKQEEKNREKKFILHDNEIVDKVGELFNLMKKRLEKNVNPINLIKYLGIDTNVEQDVSEFLSSILLKLYESNIRGFIDEHFYGTIQNSLKCISCGLTKRKEERFVIHICPLIRNIYNLQVLMKKSVEKQVLTDINKVRCENCNKLQDVEQIRMFSKLPRTLYISLPRIEFVNGRVQKNSAEIIIPKFLNIQNWNSDILSESKYQLVGLASHLGASAHTGHYIAEVKKENRWFRLNDSVVSDVSEKFSSGIIKSQKAYLVEYRLEDNDF